MRKMFSLESQPQGVPLGKSDQSPQPVIPQEDPFRGELRKVGQRREERNIPLIGRPDNRNNKNPQLFEDDLL